MTNSCKPGYGLAWDPAQARIFRTNYLLKEMANRPHSIKVLSQSNVSPPAGSVPDTSLPLTFFDAPWFLCIPMQRLFFYEFPHSTLHFTDTVLPSLESSLSHTLQIFYPFAANLICPPQTDKPHILYADGDSVPFTIAESSAEFGRTIANHQARDVQDLHPFVPDLPPAAARVINNNIRVVPLMALQVTVFPNSGICIGVKFCHVAADGKSFNHFMKAWASIFKSGRNSAAGLEKSMPSFDRNAIKGNDRRGLESILFNEWWSWASNWEEYKVPAQDLLRNKVRATFKMGRGGIERLKRYVLDQCSQLRASTFVVTSALVWTCLMKARVRISSGKLEVEDDDGFHYFCFVGDCRNRLEYTIPETYFGNCLDICFVQMKRSELVGGNGVVSAAKAIGNRVLEFEKEALSRAEKWLTDWKEISETGRLVTVSGSPKLRAYDTDFGWGKPKKTEVVQIDVSGAIGLGECRDEEGGVEMSLALKRDEMELFNGFFEQGLKAI